MEILNYKINTFNQIFLMGGGIRKAILLLISLLVTVFVIEFYLIKINYPYQNCEVVNDSAESYLGNFNQHTGWSYKKQISFYDSNNRFEYHFNKDGIRVNNPNYKIDYTRPRILFIGGSVTFGEELNYQDTFSSQIGDLLDNKFEIVNLGVQGFGTVQSMLLFNDVVEEINPKYVVFTFIPDHINRDMNYDRRLHVPCFNFDGTKPVFTIKNSMLTQIRTPQKITSIDRFKLPLFLSMSHQNFIEKKIIKLGQGKDITKEVIGEIAKISNESNAKDFYIYYDTIYDDSNTSWNKELSSFLFSNIDDSRVLNFVNWAHDSKLPGAKYYSNPDDDLHPNASLSAEIAKQFVTKFNELIID